MPTIGPVIPEHLLSSVQREDNNDGEPGPLSPRNAPAPRPHLPTSTSTEDDEDDGDSWAPALPPDLAPPVPKIIGPTMPHHQNDHPDSDDDYGPMPLPVGAVTDERNDGVREFMAREERRKKELEELQKPKQLKRDAWMLVPPKSSDLLGSLDPTKLKARQFSRTTEEKPTASTLWTETPAERQARLVDETMGKRKRSEIGAGGRQTEEETDEDRKRRRRDAEIDRHVNEHNKSERGATLLQMHSTSDTTSTASSSKDLTSSNKAIWDHERDMGLGGRLMDDATRAKFIRDAKGLSDRFGSGKSGRYM